MYAMQGPTNQTNSRSGTSYLDPRLPLIIKSYARPNWGRNINRRVRELTFLLTAPEVDHPPAPPWRAAPILPLYSTSRRTCTLADRDARVVCRHVAYCLGSEIPSEEILTKDLSAYFWDYPTPPYSNRRQTYMYVCVWRLICSRNVTSAEIGYFYSINLIK